MSYSPETLYRLLVSHLQNNQWMLKGLCNGNFWDDSWFPNRGESQGEKRNYTLTVCFECPVRKECNSYRRSADPPYGVWGGILQTSRNSENRRRQGSRRA